MRYIVFLSICASWVFSQSTVWEGKIGDKTTYLHLDYPLITTDGANQKACDGSYYFQMDTLLDRYLEKCDWVNENKIVLDLNKKLIVMGDHAIPIKNFAITAYNNKGKLSKKFLSFNKRGLNVIFMKDYRKLLIVDDFYYNSTFFQLFIFENTKGIFKPVIITPYVKVYKLIK